MVVYDDIEVDVTKTLIVTRLGVDDGIAGKLALIDFLCRDYIELEQSDHGQIVRPRDCIYTGDGGCRDPSPQKAFQRHGAGHGIRVCVDEDKQAVFSRKKAKETAQFF